MVLEEGKGGVRQFHDVWREEGGDDTDCHDDGVEGGVGHVQVLSEAGDDEGELANLNQREACLQCHSQRLSGEECAQTGKDDLSDDDHEGDDGDGQPVL